jgi:hypothetical protein
VKTYLSGVKASGNEADDSPPFIADAKNGGAVLTLPNMSYRAHPTSSPMDRRGSFPRGKMEGT